MASLISLGARACRRRMDDALGSLPGLRMERLASTFFLTSPFSPSSFTSTDAARHGSTDRARNSVTLIESRAMGKNETPGPGKLVDRLDRLPSLAEVGQEDYRALTSVRLLETRRGPFSLLGVEYGRRAVAEVDDDSRRVIEDE